MKRCRVVKFTFLCYNGFDHDSSIIYWINFYTFGYGIGNVTRKEFSMLKPKKEIMNREYLMTNGLGGYSFSTLDDVNCRKYHSLYTVSYAPPVQRMHLISKMVPIIEMGNRSYVFSRDNHMQSESTESCLNAYQQEGVVEQVFCIDAVSIKRRLAFEYGSNAFAVTYEIDVPEESTLKLEPWFHFRDHHDVMPIDIEAYKAHWQEEEGILAVRHNKYEVFLKSDAGFLPFARTTDFVHYPIETQRGYGDQEQHVVLGYFVYELKKGINTIEVLINIQPEFVSADKIFDGRNRRYQKLIDKAGFKDKNINRLVQAADDFIVHRANTGKKTIIAGYPWFTDWGRDTMISLPGLTLSTKRYEEGLQMIEGFLSKAYKGIIPNNFPDEGEAPMYNTSDGTLWLFNAVYAYYERTKDKLAIDRILPQLLTILEYHMKGTINDIYMDEDGLLNTGNKTTQLTWMDVKVDGWVVTPRHGKAVEINALWYNALKVTAYLAREVHAEGLLEPLHVEAVAEMVFKSFNDKFWCENEGILYDLIIGGKPKNIKRPNMIFAVSLPFSVLLEERQKSVVDYVKDHLKVAYGLLTLNQEDPDFCGRYEGNLLSRDGAYHRGTAWAWLLGPYFEAHFKIYKDKAYILNELEQFYTHLDEGVLGSVSEIFEGYEPHAQRGCSAQAWSVAEIIRIYESLELDTVNA